MTLEIVSYGNGALLTKVIMGVSYIMSNSNYLLLIQLVVILAFVVGLIVSHRENVTGGSVGLKLIGTLAVAGVIWSSSYLPQDTVIVYDPVNNYQTSVRNVPVTLAMPMYLENSIGDGLASLYDAYMGKSGFPNSLSYNNTGFNWGSIATQQLQNVSFVNPYDQATINSYLVNCYFPAVQLGHANLLDLYNSDNLLQTLQQGSQTSDAFLAQVYNSTTGQSNYEDCNTVYNYIVGMVNATTSTGSAARSYAATVDGKTQAHGLVLSQVMDNLGPAADFLLNTGLDSQQLIAQMAIANSFSPAFQQFSAKFGVPDNNLSFGVAQTEYQQQTVWVQTAFMARIFLPILHFIMEAIIFGSFPLIFLMTLIPGFSKKAFGYIMSMLMWLTFWAPLMSILNGLSAWLISTNAFPLNVTGGNVNLNDMGYIYSNLREWAAMIGSASMTVPMLAYGLATMSSFVGAETVAGISGAISGGINTAAQTVATENGAQGLQNQAQNMMQNQANNAYTDPSQFDGLMDYNAESVAAQRQAMADYIHQRGMGVAEQADFGNINQTASNGIGFLNNASAAGMSPLKFGEMQKETGVQVSGSQAYSKILGHGYGNMLDNGQMSYNTTNGMFDGTSQMSKPQAEGFVHDLKESGYINSEKEKQFDNVIKNSDGLVSVGYQGLSNNGNPKFSTISLSNGTKAETWSNASIADTNKIDGGTSIMEKGAGARPYLNNSPFSSIFKGRKINGTYTEGGGVSTFAGAINRTQAQGLINDGIITKEAAYNLKSALNQNPNVKTFAFNAQYDKNGIMGLEVSNKQGTVLAREGNITDYSLDKAGHTNENLNNTLYNDEQKYVFGPKVEGSTQNINDYARRYMEAKNALGGSLAGYSSPQRAVQVLDEAKTLAKEGQFKAAGAVLRTFNMNPNQYKTEGAYSVPSIENAANSRIEAIQREEQNMHKAGNDMVASSIAYHNEAAQTGAPMSNANQSFYETTAKPLQEFYNTQLSTSVKNGVASDSGSKSSTTNRSTLEQSYKVGVNIGKIIDPSGGLDIGISGKYTHQTIYSAEQYSSFKHDWSNATTVEARTNVLMKTYSEGLSNIDNMNISGTEKAELKAKLLQGFYGAA